MDKFSPTPRVRTAGLIHRAALGVLLSFVLLMALGVQHLPLFAQEKSTTKLAAVKLEPLSQLTPQATSPATLQVAAAKGWALSADFDVVLSRKLQEALDRGLPLKFAVDFRLLKPRWYWTDEESIEVSYPLTLSYHALTRTYRLVTPNNTLTTSSLKDALDAMSHIKNWTVIPSDRIRWGQSYRAQVRFRLDVNELPKPFQISALVSSQWDLSSDWVEFQFTPRQEALK
ncbi:MAG: DUF4390 domain-containing protein [Limnobacter sp.]|nr:DUF4390 domain-containing protein [Limnobacter sp.]